MISIEFEGVKVSAESRCTMEDLIMLCAGAAVAAGYDSNAMQGAMESWFYDRDYVVLSQEEYEDALDAARKEAIEDEKGSEFSQEDYDAGYSDGYIGAGPQPLASDSYNDGYDAGEAAAEEAETAEAEAEEAEDESQEMFDLGYEHGYNGAGLDLDSSEDESYMDGFEAGQKDLRRNDAA
jgi:hypothetical protein